MRHSNGIWKINLTLIDFCSILNAVAKNLTKLFFCGILHTVVWGCSSVGRASGLQPEGQRFKSAHLHSIGRVDSVFMQKKRQKNGSRSNFGKNSFFFAK